MTNIKAVTTERIYQKPFQTLKTQSGKKECEKEGCPVNFKGTDALAEYNKPLVCTKDHWWELSLEQLQNVKDELDFVLDLIEEDCGEKPDDETVSFVVSSLCNLNTENLGYELNGIGIAFTKFMQFTPEERELFFNSNFIRLAVNALEFKGSKFSCFNIPKDKLEELNKLTEDKLTARFLKDYLKTRSKNGFDVEEALPDIEKTIAPVVEFTKKEGAEEFYDLLLQRDYEDISELSEILSKRFEGLTSIEKKELYSLLKILLKAKTPDGKNIFGCSRASDTTEKMLFSGIENILDAKENNPEKFEQLMKLLKLTQSGDVPPSVLGTLPKKAEINKDFLALINNPKDEIEETDGKIFYRD